MKNVTIYTDGACLGNPGVGGWAAILEYNQIKKEIFGAQGDTTNNRMELTAAIEGMQALKEPCSVLLVTDSKYISDAIEKKWLFGWSKNGWKKSDKSPVLNQDLWEKLLQQLSKHTVELQWVKGHNAHLENERCDYLATTAAKNEI